MGGLDGGFVGGLEGGFVGALEVGLVGKSPGRPVAVGLAPINNEEVPVGEAVTDSVIAAGVSTALTGRRGISAIRYVNS